MVNAVSGLNNLFLSTKAKCETFGRLIFTIKTQLTIDAFVSDILMVFFRCFVCSTETNSLNKTGNNISRITDRQLLIFTFQQKHERMKFDDVFWGGKVRLFETVH